MSGEHAVIVTILNDSFLEDLGSTNGTMVNGKPIKKHFLQNNDVIELGKYKLKYVGEAAAPGRRRQGGLREDHGAAPAQSARQTGGEALRSAPGVAAPRPRCRRPPPRCAGNRRCHQDAPRRAPQRCRRRRPAAPEPLGAIQLLSGANAGKELELTKPLTTLGKPGVQVAVLTRRPQGYFITHVEGATCPIVNGQPIGAGAHALKDHDVIELAGVKMEFFLKA